MLKCMNVKVCKVYLNMCAFLFFFFKDVITIIIINVCLSLALFFATYVAFSERYMSYKGWGKGKIGFPCIHQDASLRAKS